MNPKLSVASVALMFTASPYTTQPLYAQPSPSERVSIAYVAPTERAHQPLHDVLKENQALERIRDVLVRIRWPRTLRLEVKGCDGEVNAWYDDAVVTVCYEYLEEMWRAANSRNRPAHIERKDAFVGPIVDTILHESGHAAFDLLKIPLFGREEDAADQFAAYTVLQMQSDKKKSLILGAAWGFASELKVRRVRDLSRPRLAFGRHITNADEHGTPAQRLYNLLCIAYGSDKVLFGDVVEKGLLPQERAEQCEAEYRQVDYAFRTLIAPHMDGVAPK